MIIRRDTNFKFRIAKPEFLIDTADAVDGHLLDLDFFSPENVIFLVILLALFHGEYRACRVDVVDHRESEVYLVHVDQHI